MRMDRKEPRARMTYSGLYAHLPLRLKARARSKSDLYFNILPMVCGQNAEVT